MTSKPKPIMLRAYLTESEWAQIRKRAIDEGLHTGEFVTMLIRAGLTSMPKGRAKPARPA